VVDPLPVGLGGALVLPRRVWVPTLRDRQQSLPAYQAFEVVVGHDRLLAQHLHVREIARRSRFEVRLAITQVILKYHLGGGIPVVAQVPVYQILLVGQGLVSLTL